MTHNEKIELYLKDLPSIVTEYYESCLKDTKTLSTINTYLSRLSVFFNHYENADISYFYQLTANDIQGYLDSLECGNKNKALAWTVLNSFYEFLEDKNFVLRNPVQKIERPKAENNDAVLDITCSDLFEMYDSIKNSDKKWKNRDLALFTLILCHGIKVGSVVSINVDDYDDDTHKLTLDYGERLIFGHARKALEAWLDERNNEYSFVDDDAMFLSSFKKRITTEGLRRLLTSNLEDPIYQQVKLEDVRKAMARGFLNIGISVATIQSYLNHKDARATYALLDELQRNNDSSPEEDEEAILNIYGCGSVKDLEQMLNGTYLSSDTKHDFRAVDEYRTGTTVYQLPADESTDDEVFDKKWFNKEKIYDYCYSTTEDNSLVWIEFDMFEEAGVRLSPVVFDHVFDFSRIDDIHIYAAHFDVEKYFEYNHIQNTSTIYDNYYYYFFYATGYIDDEEVSALRVLTKDKDVNQRISLFEFPLCDNDEAVDFKDVILENIEHIEDLRTSSEEMNETKAKLMSAFCKARLTVLDFIKSFEGSEPLHDTLDEQIEEIKNVDNMISQYLLFTAIKGLSDTVKGLVGENNDNDDDDDDDDVEFESFGENHSLLKSDRFDVSFDEVQMNDDGESARIYFRVHNHTNGIIHVWLTGLTLDGSDFDNPYHRIGDVYPYSDGYLYLPLDEISFDTYYDISFVVDVSDESDKTIEETNTIEMRIDFEDEEVIFEDINSESDDEDEDEEDENNSFGTPKVLFSNNDFEVSFDCVTTDEYDDSAEISFRVDNHTSKPIHLWLTQLKLDDNDFDDPYQQIGAVDSYSHSYMSLSLEDMSLSSYYDLSFVVDISGEDNGTIEKTNPFKMRINFGLEYVLFLDASENENDDDDDDDDDEYDNYESFGESEVLFDNGDFEVSFDEIHMDEDESARIYFKIHNRTSNQINIWLTGVKLDDEYIDDSCQKIGEVEGNYIKYLFLPLQDLSFDTYYDLDFVFDISDENNLTIEETTSFNMHIDFADQEVTIQEGYDDDDDDDDILEEETNSESLKVTPFPLSNITRISSMESALGIDDLKMYAYIADDTLYIVGEIIAEQIYNDFVLKCTIYDADGDMIESFENSSYGSGLVTSYIKKKAFFNGYPFMFVKMLKKNTSISKIRIIPG